MQFYSVQRKQSVSQIFRISLQLAAYRNEILTCVQPVACRALADGACIRAHAILIIVVVGGRHRIRICLLRIAIFEMEHALSVGEYARIVFATHGGERDIVRSARIPWVPTD